MSWVSFDISTVSEWLALRDRFNPYNFSWQKNGLIFGVPCTANGKRDASRFMYGMKQSLEVPPPSSVTQDIVLDPSF